MKWINESGRPKSSTFTCSSCHRKAHYIDGNSRSKYSTKESVCGYIYCPWCGEKNREAAE